VTAQGAAPQWPAGVWSEVRRQAFRPVVRSLLLPWGVVVLVGGCGRSGDVLEVAGTTEIRQVQLAPLTSGRLVRLLKDEGETVRRGDTVAVLEQPGLDALISQRRAQARAASLRVNEVVAALADSTRAANDLARAHRLVAQNIMSQQQYDALTAAAAAAAARLAAVRAAPSESAAAGAALAMVLAVRDELTLVAPADGIVLTRDAEPGEAVSTGMPIVSLGLVRQPWIRAYVEERSIARLKVGQAVTVRLDGADAPLSGRIVEIAPQAEFTPRVALTERERADLVFGVKVEVAGGDANGRLKAGMPVTLVIPLAP
jgi:HlyD family secretion protein